MTEARESVESDYAHGGGINDAAAPGPEPGRTAGGDAGNVLTAEQPEPVGPEPAENPRSLQAVNPWSGIITFGGNKRTKRQVLTVWQTRIFALSWLTYAAFYFPRNAFSAAKVGILEEGVISRQDLGLLDSAYLAAYAVGQFVWGALAERFGTRVVVAGGMVMAGVAALFMGIVPALWLFLPLMVVQGLAQSTGWSALSKNIASFFTTRVRGRAMGFFSTSYAFGGLVAVPVMGWVAYSVFDSWRMAFVAGAVVIGVVFVGFIIFQRNSPKEVGLPGIVYFMLKPARYAILLWGPVLVLDAIPGISAVTAADLRDARFFMREIGSSTRATQDVALKLWGCEDAPQWTIWSAPAALEFVHASVGVSLMSEHLAGRDLAAGRLVALNVQPAPPRRPVTVVHLAGATLRPIENDLIAALTRLQRWDHRETEQSATTLATQ